MVLGSSRRVSSLIDFLSPHVLLADPTLPPPPAPTLGGMHALAHLAGQGDRTVHGARPASRPLPADPPDPPAPRTAGRGSWSGGPPARPTAAGGWSRTTRGPARWTADASGSCPGRSSRAGCWPATGGRALYPERAGYTPPHTRTAPPGRRGRSALSANS